MLKKNPGAPSVWFQICTTPTDLSSCHVILRVWTCNSFQVLEGWLMEVCLFQKFLLTWSTCIYWMLWLVFSNRRTLIFSSFVRFFTRLSHSALQSLKCVWLSWYTLYGFFSPRSLKYRFPCWYRKYRRILSYVVDRRVHRITLHIWVHNLFLGISALS